MKASLVIGVIFMAAMGAGAAPESATNIFESDAPVTAECRIDELVFAKFATMKIQPVLCSDAVFVRRAYLDVIGTLPTAAEAREFIEDKDVKNKRRALIDKLLERTEFADYWAMKWGDILRIKAEFPVNLWPNAAQAYHQWVRASITANKHYDEFARELLTSSGSNFRVGPVNFYRAVQNRNAEGIAMAVALTFMGSRAEKWPTEKLSNMSAFFSQIGYKATEEWKEECVFWDPCHAAAVAGNVSAGKAELVPPPPGTKKKPTEENEDAAPPPPAAIQQPQAIDAVFPDGSHVTIPADRDPRDIFANWLISEKNPWFAKNIVNRVWSWLLGRGIIHEPDDIREDNPPSNAKLLAYLEKELVASKYDLKHIYRIILNSKTYQLSSMPRFKNPKAEANFATYPLRRLDAEVLIDAINKITGTSDLYTSAIPEPFTYIPRDLPAIAIADGSITSPFLTLFGRSARATGMENERINKPVSAQWLHLLNSSHIQNKLEMGPGLRAIVGVAGKKKPDEIAQDLYLTILSRFPTAEEVKAAMEYSPPAGSTSATPVKITGKSGSGSKYGKWGGKQTVVYKNRDEWIDIAWALINSTEFLYRH